ncbi:hypothetical protein ACGFMK_35630 [Amycolatopsis sp. NPDC049252]|uniref:hypothetical protein n=1 Tax=Amycolatopsis sp. NPDC049252 TaxID=3363933 RepID=UPI0037103478
MQGEEQFAARVVVAPSRSDGVVQQLFSTSAITLPSGDAGQSAVELSFGCAAVMYVVEEPTSVNEVVLTVRQKLTTLCDGTGCTA